MRAIEGIRRSGVAIRPDQTMAEAAEIMERAGVGALAVVDGDHLVGIVTDRDLVRRGLARGYAPDVRVDSLMSSPVVTIEADADLRSAYAIFRSNAVRRLVVTERGHFAGVLAIDDLLINIAADLSDLVRPVTAEAIIGHRDSPVP
ncbi:MAG TPA: CBS domain-containing protein, partial [Acidimicrobiales bacterium]|nr:CBS domain-containing protein [Acidimicrobiales bacterium]